jgi:L,D-transpeptidase YcbB
VMDSGAANNTERAQYDLLLTDALLRLGYHMMFGKVDATSFDAVWNYGRTIEALDVAAGIERALNSGDITQVIDRLRPSHALYQRLRSKLARYRLIEGKDQFVPSGATLKEGNGDERVIALRARLQQLGDLATTTQSSIFDNDLAAAVSRFQKRHGLDADGAVGKGTLAELNVPLSQRVEQMRINLDRGRVLLHDLPEEFVAVNVAGFRAWLVRDGKTVWQGRVQVGRSYRKTPIFRSTISYLVLNPTWTVPPGIIQNDILPDARRDPAAITRKGLKVFDNSGSEIAPSSVDWSRFRSGHIPYTLRQDPGPTNAMGRVKIMFQNDHLVYLHDTPSQTLFDRAERTFSSGCVRIENALSLATLLLDNQPRWDANAIASTVKSNQMQNVSLTRKIPVLLAYWTAWVDDEGQVNFRRDIYEQDAQWLASLRKPFQIRAQPLFQ